MVPGGDSISAMGTPIGSNGLLFECDRSSQLLRACRLIHTEALPILYSSNTLTTRRLFRLKLGLEKIGAKARAHVRQICVDDSYDACQFDDDEAIPLGPGAAGEYRMVRTWDTLNLRVSEDLQAFVPQWPIDEKLEFPHLPCLETLILRYKGETAYTPEFVAARILHQLFESNPVHGNIIFDSLSVVSPTEKVTCLFDLNIMGVSTSDWLRTSRTVVRMGLVNGETGWAIEEIENYA